MKPFLKKIKVSQAGWHTPFIPILEGAEADQSRLHIKALTDKTELKQKIVACVYLREVLLPSIKELLRTSLLAIHPVCVGSSALPR